MTQPIRTKADLSRELSGLLARDGRLSGPAQAVGELPLRLQPPGLAGLLRIVAGQQLSTQSAAAVWKRFIDVHGTPDAAAIAGAEEGDLRAAGLSRQKARTFRAVSEAVVCGLDLEALATGDAGEARSQLEAICGIGRWSADLYLMFCAGHPDILPTGDLAVRRGAQHALALEDEPAADALDMLGEAWAPHRSTASRLFWAYYRVAKDAQSATAKRREAAVDAGMPL
ncbi:MAG: DNA-3-methyladenine glycosylase 2 family protein [Pseudomonadota bacterium]